MARPKSNTRDVPLLENLESVRTALARLQKLVGDDAADALLAGIVERDTSADGWKGLAAAALFEMEGRKLKPGVINKRLLRARAKLEPEPKPEAPKEIFSDGAPDPTDLPLHTRWTDTNTLRTYLLCSDTAGGKVWAQS